MKETMIALKAVVKMAMMWLYESNTEAIWINKRIQTWVKSPIWKGYWSFSQRVAEEQAKAYLAIANRL